MKFISVFIVFFLFMNIGIASPTPEWIDAKNAGSTYDDAGFSIEVDNQNNKYIIGNFKDTAYFDSITKTSNGNSDIFIAKIDSLSNFIWVLSAGGSDYDVGKSIFLDSSNNIYVTGYFQETANFGNNTLVSNGYEDIFVAKIDTSGEWQWATKAGGPDNWEEGYKIIVDDSNDIYITGRYKNNAIFGQDTLSSKGESDIFIAKLNCNGDWQWVKTAGGNNEDIGHDVIINNNDIYCTGFFEENAEFGQIELIGSDYQDIFVAMMNEYGEWEWAQKAGGTGQEEGMGIEIDSNENLYVTGFFREEAFFNTQSLYSSSSEVFISCLNSSNGEWIWAKQTECDGHAKSYSIYIDDSDNLYIIGYYTHEMYLDDKVLTTNGINDLFIANFDNQGNWLWAINSGNTYRLFGEDISIDNNGNISLVGQFDNSCVIGNDSLFSYGHYDIIIAETNSIYSIEADFNATPVNGVEPLEVYFNDNSTGLIYSWEWDFENDGIIDSYEQNPINVYQNSGIYSVYLKVSNHYNYHDTKIENNLIEVFESVVANGYALLFNNDDNSGIEIVFNRIAPDTFTDTTYTDSTGYYEINLIEGIYEITYYKSNYYEKFIELPIYTNTNLQDITLYSMVLVPQEYQTIQEGINACLINDTVIVDPGIYFENIDFSGKNITLTSKYLSTNDTSFISNTIVDGGQNGSVVTFSGGEDTTAALQGFTIRNGFNQYGSGICCENNSCPKISNMKIINNTAQEAGGGISCSIDSSPNLRDALIINNNAKYGAGIACYWRSNPVIINSNICYNIASIKGGGIYCDYENPSPKLLNTIVSNNFGNYGLYVSSGNPTIEFCNFYDNENGSFFGCGQWIGNNVTTNTNGDSCDAYNNIQENPLFINPNHGNFHLGWFNYPVHDSTMSPCIDAGDPDTPLDPDGTIVDMGVYYYNQNVSVDDSERSIEYDIISFPNPVNSNIKNFKISFYIHKPGKVKIQLFNLKGQLVSWLMNEEKNIGEYSISYSVNDLSSGIYFTKMSVDGIVKEISKIILLR